MFLQLPVMPPKSHPPDVFPFLSALEKEDDSCQSRWQSAPNRCPQPCRDEIAVWVPADNLGLCQHPTHILLDSNSFCKIHSQACSSHQQSPPGDCLSLTIRSRWKTFSQRIPLLGTEGSHRPHYGVFGPYNSIGCSFLMSLTSHIPVFAFKQAGFQTSSLQILAMSSKHYFDAATDQLFCSLSKGSEKLTLNPTG